MIKQLYYFLAIALTASFLNGCAGSDDPADRYKEQNDTKLFEHAKKSLDKEDYDEAISYLETLDARYPFGTYTQQGQLDTIFAYFKKADYASALASVDRYLHLYPMDRHLDYAYYLRGLIHFDQNHGPIEKWAQIDFSQRDLEGLQQAYLDFSQLTTLYPKSKYAADSRQRMIYIRHAIAKWEWDAAEFYYNHGLYVAAINRANEIVKHYQGSAFVPKALALLVKAYKKLNLNQEAKDTLKLLQANYPDTKEVLS